MRFASREKAVLSQWKSAPRWCLVRPDGPPASPHRARPARWKVLLAGEDISGDLAERYGYVNRALPDASWTTS